MTNFPTIPMTTLDSVNGGKDEGPVSPETIGCAVGGAAGSAGGPLGTAVGCVAGGAIANRATNMSNADRAKFTKQARIAHLGR